MENTRRKMGWDHFNIVRSILRLGWAQEYRDVTGSGVSKRLYSSVASIIRVPELVYDRRYEAI
jgi:hypothetical protein